MHLRLSYSLMFGIYLVLEACNSNKSLEDIELEPKTTSLTYLHKYEKGQISSTEVMSTFYDGQDVTPMSSYTEHFSYNDKNLLVEERQVSEDGRLLSTKSYQYNAQDSLISIIEVYQQDTTLIELFEVFPDGRKQVLQRRLERLSDEAGNTKLQDIFHFRNAYAYRNNQLWKSTEHDLVARVESEVRCIYEDDKLVSEVHVKKFGDGKLRNFTKKYNYSKSETLPDWVLFDAQGDTITMIIHRFAKGKLQQTSSLYFEEGFRQEEYFENGLLKKLFVYSANEDKPNFKVTYTHNKRGEIVQELIWMK